MKTIVPFKLNNKGIDGCSSSVGGRRPASSASTCRFLFALLIAVQQCFQDQLIELLLQGGHAVNAHKKQSFDLP